MSATGPITSSGAALTSPDPGIHGPTTGPEAAPAMLPEPVPDFVGLTDTASMLADMLIKSAQGSKDIARTRRDSCDQAALAAEKQEVADMHKEADQIRASGWTAAAFDVASGALTIGGGCVPDAKGKLDAIAKLYEVEGNLIKSLNAADQKDLGAIEKNDGVAADTANRASKAANDAVDDAKEMVSTVLEFLRQYYEAKHQGTLAAVHAA